MNLNLLLFMNVPDKALVLNPQGSRQPIAFYTLSLDLVAKVH